MKSAGGFRALFRGSRTEGRRSDRGAVELGVALLGGVLVVGAVAGNGVASTALSTSDGSTWLADGSTGQVVQLDPTTGLIDQRLQVGADGSVLDIAQANGYLVVTDADGNITSIDLSTLLASGQRSVGAGDDVRVLIGRGQMYLVDVTNGTLRAVNPLTLADLGEPYRSRGLTDAVVDGKGTIWIVDGRAIKKVHWDATAHRFVVEQTKKLQGVGGRTRLTAHAQGVSVFAPDGGAIVQLGTGRKDLAVAVRSLEGEVAAATNAPADLVPASMTGDGRVVMVSGREVLSVAVKDIGCARPGTPAVFAGKVYVPCTGERRVIALNRQGKHVGSDVMVQGSGDPQLLVDEGHLIVQSGDKTSTVIVDQDGSSRAVDTSGQGAARNVKQKAATPASRAWSKAPSARETKAQQARRSNGASSKPSSGKPTNSSGKASPGTSDGTGAGPCTGADCLAVADPCVGSTDPACTGTEPQPADPQPADPQPVAPEPQPEPEPEPPPEPHAPEQLPAAGVAASASGSQVVVTWTPPASVPSHFEVTSSDGKSAQVAGNAGRATLDGVQCSAQLTIDVVAVYPDGTRVAGNQATVSTSRCAPQPVSGVFGVYRPVSGKFANVTVTWNPAPDADAYIIVYPPLAQRMVVTPGQLFRNADGSVFFSYGIGTYESFLPWQVITVVDGQESAPVSGGVRMPGWGAADPQGDAKVVAMTSADRASDASAAPSATGPRVEVTSAPWAAPEVGNPPMLGAGVALLLPVAGLWSWRGVRRSHTREVSA